MNHYPVTVTRYQSPFESVRQSIASCGGLQHMPPRAKVFIKPNIVFWTKATDFPKWGVITTSRIVEDVVQVLKENGAGEITIGEGIVTRTKDRETPAHAFTALGYETLRQRYGINYLNVMDRPFREVDLGDGVTLSFNEDILDSDFVVDLPTLKTHNQTTVSLGIKNLKGVIDTTSRKTCHNPDPERDLHFHVARLANGLPPILTLIDGIYSLERGPAFDGKMHRSNLLVASPDILSTDKVGARLLGHHPGEVPHLARAAENRDRPADLSDLELYGERIEEVASYHTPDVEYVRDERRELPKPLAKQGIQGLYYRKFDSTMCTYCSGLNGLVLTAIRQAYNGEPWDDIEVLTGKAMEPTPGMKTTILLGQCMYRKNKDHPNIQRQISVKGCPPQPRKVLEALHEAGINADSALFEQMDKLPGFFLERYKDLPEFEEDFFRVP